MAAYVSALTQTAITGKALVARPSAQVAKARAAVVTRAERALWAPGVVAPKYLDGTLAGWTMEACRANAYRGVGEHSLMRIYSRAGILYPLLFASSQVAAVRVI
jgi:hypothetical protein